MRELGAKNTDFATEQARWDALVQRDPESDGAYWYGVTTTGVYCRPTCPSRQPNRENVRFFDTWQQAEGAGFRPCKRCNPRDSRGPEPHAATIARVCHLIDESEEPPTLAELATAVGLSPSYLHRLFKKMVGVTPKQYAMEKRMDHVRERLQTDTTVTDVIYESGFGSSSRFYQDITEKLGMKPSQYRNGGQGTRIHAAVAQSYLGWILVAATARGICAIEFDDSPDTLRERLHARFPNASVVENDPEFGAVVSRVLSFLDSPYDGLDLPLDVRLVIGHPQIEETRNQVAVVRGPVVYCLESIDLARNVPIAEVQLPRDVVLEPEFVPDLLGGVTVLKGRGHRLKTAEWSNQLYRDLEAKPLLVAQPVCLIPYFAWNNRGLAEMTVWLPLS